MNHFELTNGHFLGITRDNASSNYSMTPELQSTLEASGIKWPAMRNYIPCMAHVIQHVLGASMSNLSVKGCTRSWEAYERYQQIEENERTNIGQSQKLRKEDNARTKNVSALRPGLAKIIDKVHIPRHSERPETNLHIAENAYCVDYADTWSLKRVPWLSKGHSTNSSTTYHWGGYTVEFHTGVAGASLLIPRIRSLAAEESQIQQLPATLHITGWMDNRQVRHGSFEAIPILDPADVEKAYGYCPWCLHCQPWNVLSYGWPHASFG